MACAGRSSNSKPQDRGSIFDHRAGERRPREFPITSSPRTSVGSGPPSCGGSSEPAGGDSSTRAAAAAAEPLGPLQWTSSMESCLAALSALPDDDQGGCARVERWERITRSRPSTPSSSRLRLLSDSGAGAAAEALAAALEVEDGPLSQDTLEHLALLLRGMDSVDPGDQRMPSSSKAAASKLAASLLRGLAAAPLPHTSCGGPAAGGQHQPAGRRGGTLLRRNQSLQDVRQPPAWAGGCRGVCRGLGGGSFGGSGGSARRPIGLRRSLSSSGVSFTCSPAPSRDSKNDPMDWGGGGGGASEAGTLFTTPIPARSEGVGAVVGGGVAAAAAEWQPRASTDAAAKPSMRRVQTVARF